MDQFKLEFIGVSIERSSNAPARSYYVLLDVKSENEPKETFRLGPWPASEDRKEKLAGLSYIASSPIRVRAWSEGRLLSTDLGVHILYDHLHMIKDDNVTLEGTLVFGSRRKGMPLVKLQYMLSRVCYKFHVDLAEVRCLQMAGWWWREQLLARVGGVSYDLGTFQTFGTTSPQAFKTTVVSRAEVIFLVRGWLLDQTLGHVVLEGGSDGKLKIVVDGEEQCRGSGEEDLIVTLKQRYALTFKVRREDFPRKSNVAPSGLGAAEDEAMVTHKNHVEVLVDGLQTFEHYFHTMMDARHSICILAWELSLSFGLITADRGARRRPKTTPQGARWISLEDVLLAKAQEGVRVRVLVWRHQLMTYLNRFLYLGEVTIEAEVNKLIERGKTVGVTVRMVHAPQLGKVEADIVIVIVGNPRGVLSSHHEKLVLIDADCKEGHGSAYVGGFDIARGRYDQPLHQIPKPYFELNPPTQNAPRYTGPEVQPVLRRIRFLWHDVQVLLRGPIVPLLHLHFEQRWIHAFGATPAETRALTLPPLKRLCKTTQQQQQQQQQQQHSSQCDATVQLVRCWRGVMDVQRLYEVHRRMIRSAKRFLFIEHQYPFHNWGLTYDVCEALRTNPNLKVLIVTAVKTDLPTGIVGDLVDWSQDHITQHLLHIHSVAPDRVGVFGLCRQDEYRHGRIKPIYVHTKLVVVDDELIVTGSANMDDMSFFFSSELTLRIFNPQLAKKTRLVLASEHLGSPASEDFNAMYESFHALAMQNLTALSEKRQLTGRPVFMAPKDRLDLLLSRVYYPSKVSKALYKLGVNTEDWVDAAVYRIRSKL